MMCWKRRWSDMMSERIAKNLRVMKKGFYWYFSSVQEPLLRLDRNAVVVGQLGKYRARELMWICHLVELTRMKLLLATLLAQELLQDYYLLFQFFLREFSNALWDFWDVHASLRSETSVSYINFCLFRLFEQGVICILWLAFSSTLEHPPLSFSCPSCIGCCIVSGTICSKSKEIWNHLSAYFSHFTRHSLRCYTSNGLQFRRMSLNYVKKKQRCVDRWHIVCVSTPVFMPL